MNPLRGALSLGGAPRLLLLGAVALYTVLVVPRLLWRDADGLHVGHEHLWSDWPLHLGMARRFADTPPDQWLAHHPMLGGTPLRYPFAAALLSGLLMRAGLSPEAAILAPTVVLLVLLADGLWRLFAHDAGPRRAALAALLFFLGAGPGGLAWCADVARLGIDALLLPPREYGRLDDPGLQWYAGSFLTGMLLPQRAFLPGMTAAVWLLHALQRLLARGETRPAVWALLGAGFGALPLVHVHSVLAAVVAGVALVVRGRGARPGPAWGALTAALVGGAAWWLFLKAPQPYPGFVAWRPGYQSDGVGAWLDFWGRAWGIALPVALAGTLRREPRALPLAGWGLFAAANLILFQPIAWDNSKVFLWAYALLCPALADALAWVWRLRWGGKAAAAALTVALSLTGVAECVALARPDQRDFLILDRDDLALGDAVRAKTAPGTIVLTGMDIGNGPMVWGARPIFLGFTGWMPNFGFDHRGREEDLRAIYAGWPDAAERLRRNGIGAVLVGPEERRTLGARDAWFDARYPVLARSGPKTLYVVVSPTVAP